MGTNSAFEEGGFLCHFLEIERDFVIFVSSFLLFFFFFLLEIPFASAIALWQRSSMSVFLHPGLSTYFEHFFFLSIDVKYNI